MILVLSNVTIELLNVKKKNNGATECDKSIIRCYVGTVQCDNETFKCEKKMRVPTNMIKVRSYVILVILLYIFINY